MDKSQLEQDFQYLTALSIFKTSRRKGLISDPELAQIAAFLAEKFSDSVVAKWPEIACIQ